MRVVPKLPGRSRAASAGVAGRRLQRGGAGLVGRLRCSLFGSLPCSWSRAWGSWSRFSCCSSLGLVDGALVVRACGDGLCLEDLRNKASFCCLLLGLAVVVLFPSLTGRGGEGGGSSCCRLELRLGGTRRSSHSLVIGCSASWSSPWFLVRFQWWKPTGFLAADLLNKHPRLCCVSINTQSVVLAGRGGGGDVGMDGGVADSTGCCLFEHIAGWLCRPPASLAA